jgi:hypothetical protein
MKRDKHSRIYCMYSRLPSSVNIQYYPTMFPHRTVNTAYICVQERQLVKDRANRNLTNVNRLQSVPMTNNSVHYPRSMPITAAARSKA